MNVLVALECRFEITPDGSIWAPANTGDSFWQRYLQVFDTVSVFARVREVVEPSQHRIPVGDPRIHMAPVPNYSTAWEFARNVRHMMRCAHEALRRTDAVILRVPCPIASFIHAAVRREQRPYAVEVVGDPYAVLARGAVRHRLRPILRRALYLQQRSQCSHAAGISYVTERALQSRYPSGPGWRPPTGGCWRTVRTHYSSVQLDRSWFSHEARQKTTNPKCPVVVTVGSLAQPYKGVDTLLRATDLCKRRKIDFALHIIGDGKYLESLERLSTELGLTDRVSFLGHLPQNAIRHQLDAADLFVLASRTEGLPRALLEAMARGVPCVASAVGGVPEVLNPNALVSSENPAELAQKITETLRSPELMNAMSQANLETSRAFEESVLQSRRTEFFRALRTATKLWASDKKRAV
jgi:phosphatidyl-myo-inositol dimannoside synthase